MTGSSSWRGTVVVALLAAALFLPWLGSEGLWDPWEPHYGEVAREMLVRQDLVHPHWREAWFFSKPVLLPWMGAAGLWLTDIHDRAPTAGDDRARPEPAGVSSNAEWGLRLPGALLAVLAVAVVFAAVSRLASRRAALFSSLALATSPFYALLARQALPDMPFVALSTVGAMAFAVAVFDDGDPGPGWAYAGWVALALATLAKGLLGFALVGAAFLAWFLVTGDWGRLGRARFVERAGRAWLPLGPLVFLAIATPWYVTMTLFDGRDDEGLTFARRFWLHDHLQRLVGGVHTTSPGGGFTYILEQLGIGSFPWVVAWPGALGAFIGLDPRSRAPRDRLLLLCGLWVLVGYVVMSLSATRFHHYAFPMVPPMAVLTGLFLDRLVRDGTGAHWPALLLGLAAFVVVGHAAWASPKVFTDLFVYDYGRPWPENALALLHPGKQLGPLVYSLKPRAVLAMVVFGGGAALLISGIWRSARWVAGALAGTALVLAAWLSWSHWRDLSAHWTQRDLFRTWLVERKSQNEPIVAWYMNWRGETFYSQNRAIDVREPRRLGELAARPGPIWVVVERAREAALRAELGQSRRLRVAASNDKYLLVEARDPEVVPGPAP